MEILRNPIFVGGSGRSGTSLLFSLIENCDACYAFRFRETKFIIGNDGLIDLYYSLADNFSEARAKTAINRFGVLMKRLKTGGTFYKVHGLESFLKEEKLYDEIVNNFIESLKTKSGIPIFRNKDELLMMLRNFLSELCLNIKGANPKKYFVEKTPHNFLHLKFLNQLFPDLKFVHITRDPRGVAHSLTQQDWAPDNYEDACTWLLQIYEAFIGQKKFEYYTKLNNFLQIKLEDLANQNYRNTGNEISSFLQLNKFEILENTADIGKISYWEDILTKQHYETANFILAKFIKFFGYTI